MNNPQMQKGQRSIVGFFQRKTVLLPSSPIGADKPVQDPSQPIDGAPIPRRTRGHTVAQKLTPAPSSDLVEPVGSEEKSGAPRELDVQDNGLPSPETPLNKSNHVHRNNISRTASSTSSFSSPSRKVRFPVGRTTVAEMNSPFFFQAKRVVNYAESGTEGSGEEIVVSARSTRTKSSKRRRPAIEDDEDDFIEVKGNIPADEGVHSLTCNDHLRFGIFL